MKIYIYTLTDPETNKIRYVGKSKNPKVRLRKHISEAKNSKNKNHRVYWLRKLLKENNKPILDIIDEIDGEWEWLEEYWICQLKSWGYDLVNGTNGGENPPSFKGKTHSDEYKKIRRESMIKNNPSKNMGDEWRNNISLAHKKNNFLPLNASESNKLKVYQFTLTGELIKEWGSITEAVKNIGLKNGSGIGLVCRGKRFKSGNFRWSLTKTLKKYDNNLKKIAQLNINDEQIKIWSSISQIYKELKIDFSSISKVCKGKQKTAGGFKWKYL